MCYYRANDYSKAIADFTSAIEINSKSSSYYYARSLSHYAAREYQHAITDASAAIGEREKADYYNLRGLSNHAFAGTRQYYEGRQDYYQDAVNDFSSAIKLDPNNPTYYKNRSLTYEARGEKNKAVEDVRMAKQLAR